MSKCTELATFLEEEATIGFGPFNRGKVLTAAAALRELEAENDERGATITKAAVQVTELRARVAELEAALGDCAADNHELLGDNERLREALDTAARRFEILAMQGVTGTEVVSTEVGGKEARAALEQSND